MSLYDDIDPQSDTITKSDVAGWSSSFKLLQSSLQAKKATQPQNKAKEKERQAVASTSLAPVVELSRPPEKLVTEPPRRTGGGRSKGEKSDHKVTDGLRFNQQTGRIEKIKRSSSSHYSAASLFTSAGGGGLLSQTFLGVTDEYDPLRPNDYEDVVARLRREREAQRREESKRESEQRRKRELEKERGGGDSDDEYGGSSSSKSRSESSSSSRKGTMIAPPQRLIEEDIKIKKEVEREQGSLAKNMGLAFPAGKGTTVASKIMAKMGYREGSGLGRKEQGMSSALVVEKTSRRGGKIIDSSREPGAPPGILKHHTPSASTGAGPPSSLLGTPSASLAPPGLPPAPPAPAAPPIEGFVDTAELLQNPSKVVCLRNMVGPGEVDPELEGETSEECGKYGKVNKVLIFEIPEVEADEAVRIFVEFDKMESAIKALIDLNGRFFGGRTVKAAFYNLDKFRRFDLAAPT